MFMMFIAVNSNNAADNVCQQGYIFVMAYFVILLTC